MKLGLGLSVGVLIFAIALGIFAPVISFGLGYFSGWILEICIGDVIADGLNCVFNTDRFESEMIPLFCATMGLIGGFFKSSSITKMARNNKDD